MGLKKQTKKLFKHRHPETGDPLKEKKAARKLAHEGQTVTEVTTALRTPDYHLQISRENAALRTAGGKDALKVDTRPVKKRIPKHERYPGGN
jgi:hypothetical protein